jgi:hypothetical protein
MKKATNPLALDLRAGGFEVFLSPSFSIAIQRLVFLYPDT